MTKVSILNLIPKFKDESQRAAVDRAVDLAKFADDHDFSRYWLAEHHNSPAVLGAATDLMIGHVLNQTKRITVGAGGVMLPNHTPFQVVERYATLDILHPGRVDIGIGRAPGTDMETAKLIYRNIYKSEDFKKAIQEMQLYMSDEAWDLDVAPHPSHVKLMTKKRLLLCNLKESDCSLPLLFPYYVQHFVSFTEY